MKRSLGCLDTTVAQQAFLRFEFNYEIFIKENLLFSGSDFTETDIIVGFPLLCLPSQIFSSFSHLPAWLDRIKVCRSLESFSAYILMKVNTRPWSERLEGRPVKSKDSSKKESKKTGGGGKAQEAEAKKRKLRLLCIHGYRQSGKTSREKLGSFRKLVGKVAELEFITAPHLIPSDNPEEQVRTTPGGSFRMIKNITARVSTAGGSLAPLTHSMLTRRRTAISGSSRVWTSSRTL